MELLSATAACCARFSAACAASYTAGKSSAVKQG